MLLVCRLKRPVPRRKYGLLSNYDDSVEMVEGESDEDDTLYEARSLRRSEVTHSQLDSQLSSSKFLSHLWLIWDVLDMCCGLHGGLNQEGPDQQEPSIRTDLMFGSCSLAPLTFDLVFQLTDNLMDFLCVFV